MRCLSHHYFNLAKTQGVELQPTDTLAPYNHVLLHSVTLYAMTLTNKQIYIYTHINTRLIILKLIFRTHILHFFFLNISKPTDEHTPSCSHMFTLAGVYMCDSVCKGKGSVSDDRASVHLLIQEQGINQFGRGAIFWLCRFGQAAQFDSLTVKVRFAGVSLRWWPELAEKVQKNNTVSLVMRGWSWLKRLNDAQHSRSVYLEGPASRSASGGPVCSAGLEVLFAQPFWMRCTSSGPRPHSHSCVASSELSSSLSASGSSVELCVLLPGNAPLDAIRLSIPR